MANKQLQVYGARIRLAWFRIAEELASINSEHLFDNLFALRDRFKELGMVIKNGKIYLPDLEERNG